MKSRNGTMLVLGVKEDRIEYLPLEDWEDGFMTIPEFRDELLRLYGTTAQARPININFAHYVIQHGQLPFYMGGNKLEVRSWRHSKVVRVTNIVREVAKGKGRINTVTVRRAGGIPKYKGRTFKASPEALAIFNNIESETNQTVKV